MTSDELRARVADLSVWKRGSQRASHKPLLLLWALGRLVCDQARLTPYTTVDEGVRPLLEEFGPPRRSYHSEYPFWYLQNDGLWEVTGVSAARVREGKTSQPTKTELVRVGAEGGLTLPAWRLLKEDSGLVREVAETLLEVHFAETMHDDLLHAVGLERVEIVTRRRRDPRFRDAVLIAYGYRCAFCGFDARLQHAPVGIEAAHIRWHQARGPDVVPNGLSLCALHHKLFDRGALTLAASGHIAVSPLVNGGSATDRWVVDLDGGEAEVPRSSAHHPDPAFLAWHRREVFRAG
ncbi:phosphorothioated DNA-binding restriction endonuclease [Gaopeijia maritima]|uniref:phosphorothioated DNA-binding restriction endonuclease n=1 Tax=Gaopeijia maritima TaxID=3119007 RepID=UPI00387078A2